MAEALPRLQRWREMGYKIALWRNGPHSFESPQDIFDILKVSYGYAGWGPSINTLIREVCAFDPEAQWFVGGGDDTLPDPTKTAEEIGRECSEHFGGTFGVMQPTGDLRHWPNSRIDKFAGSPWIGREFARRVYSGNGPFPPELTHMFGDEALQCIAEKLGCFWQRPDLTHKHEHWMRDGGPAPAHLTEVNSKRHWDESKAIFHRLKMEGFPGHEPK